MLFGEFLPADAAQVPPASPLLEGDELMAYLEAGGTILRALTYFSMVGPVPEFGERQAKKADGMALITAETENLDTRERLSATVATGNTFTLMGSVAGWNAEDDTADIYAFTYLGISGTIDAEALKGNEGTLEISKLSLTRTSFYTNKGVPERWQSLYTTTDHAAGEATHRGDQQIIDLLGRIIERLGEIIPPMPTR